MGQQRSNSSDMKLTLVVSFRPGTLYLRVTVIVFTAYGAARALSPSVLLSTEEINKIHAFNYSNHSKSLSIIFLTLYIFHPIYDLWACVTSQPFNQTSKNTVWEKTLSKNISRMAMSKRIITILYLKLEVVTNTL